MAKRFTDTVKWDDPWYRRLSTKHKSLWQYLCDRCDNAGVIKKDFELASFMINESVDENDVVIINNGKKRVNILDEHLVISDFIPFQIGDLNSPNLTNLQKNCVKLLENYKERNIIVTPSLPVTMTKTTDIGKGKVKGKDMVKDKVKSKKKFDFESVWDKYPIGKKIGKKEAFGYFNTTVKSEQDYIDMNKALDNYLNSERVLSGFVKDGCNWFDNWPDWINFKEDICEICRNKGKYTSSTGYEIVCKCPIGKRI